MVKAFRKVSEEDPGTLKFVFLKDVVVVFQRNISRNAENFGVKFVYVVIASVLFSPLIRPFSR